MIVTITTAQVRAKVNASEATLPDADVQVAVAVATKLVIAHIGAAEVPIEITDRAVLLVAVEQINQDNAPNGIANQVFDTDGVPTPVRIARDPMKPAYPVLAPWVSGRFFCA